MQTRVNEHAIANFGESLPICDEKLQLPFQFFIVLRIIYLNY